MYLPGKDDIAATLMIPTSAKVPCIVVLSKNTGFGTFYDIRLHSITKNDQLQGSRLHLMKPNTRGSIRLNQGTKAISNTPIMIKIR